MNSNVNCIQSAQLVQSLQSCHCSSVVVHSQQQKQKEKEEEEVEVMITVTTTKIGLVNERSHFSNYSGCSCCSCYE